MSVLQTNKLTISANGQTDVLDLNQVNYKVFVKYGSGASGTLTMRMGDTEDALIDVQVPSGAAGALADTMTDDLCFEITGGGVLGFNVSGISGEIVVTITEMVL